MGQHLDRENLPVHRTAPGTNAHDEPRRLSLGLSRKARRVQSQVERIDVENPAGGHPIDPEADRLR